MSDPLDVTGKVADAAGKGFDLAGKALDRLEGIPVRSRDRASAKSIAAMRKGVSETLAWCEREGFSRQTTDALCAAAAEKFIRVANVDGALSFARETMGREPDTSLIDHGWLMSFRRGAEDACDDEMQRVWGALLAGELEQPGSYCKRTMSILADMGRDDAEAFRHLCGACATGAPGSPDRGTPILLDIDMPLEEAVAAEAQHSLNALGLTCFTFGMYNMREIPVDADGVALSAGGRDLFLKSPGAVLPLPFYSEAFTPYGRELSGLCEMGANPDFADSLIGWAKGKGVEVYEIDEFLPGGRLKCSRIL